MIKFLRPRARRGATAVVLAAAAIAATSLTSAGAPAADARASLVGTWRLEVLIHIEEPPQRVELLCDLTADQLLDCHTTPGQDPIHGRGIWKQGPGDTFGFWITHHAHMDENGNPIGSINAQHLGRLDGRQFRTTAFTYIDLDDGSPWIGPVSVESTGVRVRR